MTVGVLRGRRHQSCLLRSLHSPFYRRLVVSYRKYPLLVCAVAAFASSSAAGAQFTAAVVPPRVKAKADTVMKQDSVRRATVALAARVTDMKKWVDSAAGVSIPAADSTSLSVRGKTDSSKTPVVKDSVILNRNARIRADSAASIATVEVHDSTGLKAPTDSAKTVPPPTSRNDTHGDTKTFASGAAAPATASLLPLLAIIGATTLLAGAALVKS